MTPARIDPIVLLLRQRRLRRGWHQGELGDLLGVHSSTVNAWERGRREPGLQILRQWADKLGYADITAIGTDGIPVWALVADDDEEGAA